MYASGARSDAEGTTARLTAGRTTAFGRAIIAAVWLYHGLWNKLLGGSSAHAEIVAAVPIGGRELLFLIGSGEVVLGLWVLAGWRPRLCAIMQTAALVAMNAGGLFWARELIVDPAMMLVQNAMFTALIWLVAIREKHCDGAGKCRC